MFATLDRLSPGRAGVHIITGSNDVEMRADGDYLTKAERYLRSREYVEVMKRMWSAAEPFDHTGPHYRFEGAFAAVKPTDPTSIPVFWGGGSPPAIENGSQVADIFALAGAAPEHIARNIQAVRAAAPARAQDIEFLISSRVIIADTEEGAWRIAHDTLRALVTELVERDGLDRKDDESMEAAIERRVDAAMVDSRDGCVFTAFGKVGIGRPIANCLVGTPDQVIGVLSDLAGLGVSRFILAGYDPRTYPAQFGEILLPRLRAAVGPILEAS
jgi:alkanesulfonate monooxygenase